MSGQEQFAICGTEPTSGLPPAPGRKRSPGRQRPEDARAAGVARIGLTVDEAAAAIGVSRDHFERHVKPGIRIVYLGSRIIVPVKELEKWVDRQAVALAAPRRGSR